jgi:hypothetical protein
VGGLREPGRPGALLAAVVCAIVFGAPSISAQIQMPDPKQMSGIPRPVEDLPGGSVSVRLIKGELSNNIAGHPVELHIGDAVQTVKTDETGRAQFDRVPAGATLKAVAVVDGERLESQAFPAPTAGGIRLLLVATDPEREKKKAERAAAPAVQGPVSIAGDSRIVIQTSEENLALYYLLEIHNNGMAPVNPPAPFEFDAPRGATRASIAPGSSPQATANGTHVKIEGPFPPGKTSVQIGIDMPITGGTVEIEQTFPAPFEGLLVIARKDGDMRLASPQLERQEDTAVEGTPVIVGAGGTVAAGQPVSITLSGLPHHSPTPRRVALSLAALVTLVGVWAARRTDATGTRSDERKRLVARREKLLQELVRLEQDQRRGRVDAARFAARREELIASLEHVYGALDTDEMRPDAGRVPVVHAPLREAGAS